MNLPELIDTIPGLIRDYVDGAETLRPVAVPDLDSPTWTYRGRQGRALVAFHISGGELPMVQITAGVATDLAYSCQLSEYVNYVNFPGSSALTFGRMYLRGPIPMVGLITDAGPCEARVGYSVLGESLSMDFAPSAQYLIDVCANVGDQADILAGEMLERFDGRLYRDDEAAVLTKC